MLPSVVLSTLSALPSFVHCSHIFSYFTAMRAMLDELMGKERNVPLEERNTNALSWDDPGVCKYQLCGPCPSKLFKNTKSDLGAHTVVYEYVLSMCVSFFVSCARKQALKKQGNLCACVMCAGPCEFEYHDDHLEWPRIKEDFDKADPRDQER